MAKRPDDTLILVLSEKEASILRNIVEPPAPTSTQFSRSRLIQILLVILVLAAGAGVGFFHPELARALVESVMLLIV